MTEIIDRLRTEANCIDDTGDVELRALLAEAAEKLEQFEFAGRWSADCARQADAARKEAQAEVERLKAHSNRWRAAYVKLTNNVEFADNGEGCYVACNELMREFDSIAEESPAQSLAEIEARAVEALLKDLRSDMPDTNTARRIFQRMQLRVDVLRQGLKQHGPEYADWASLQREFAEQGVKPGAGDRGVTGHEREVLGQNNEGDGGGMSLYQCEYCGCMENTALGCFHSRHRVELFKWDGMEDRSGMALCSACGPTRYRSGNKTGFGKWHGEFERIYLPKGQFRTNGKGNLEHIETGDTNIRRFRLSGPDNGYGLCDGCQEGCGGIGPSCESFDECCENSG